ncbi:HAMP domain-containing protein, partial [Escherichia coli]
MSETTIPRNRKKPLAIARGNGEARDLIDDAAAMRSRQLLAAMVAFRDGDFSVRLPRDWPGTDGRIAEAFNQTLAHQ